MDIIEKLLNNNKSLQYRFPEEDVKISPMCNYYKGKTILLTGATGFLGQLLLEKLLRCDIKEIFILTRPKKNTSPAERFKEYFEGVLFYHLRQQNPNFMDKITIVEGDFYELGLALKADDIDRMAKSVEIIFHAAADVRFNKPLVDMIFANVRGTRELLKLAVTFEKLQVFNYISTAYSNCANYKCVKEKFYPASMEPEIAIRLAEQLARDPIEQEKLEVITERLIHPWPNTYTFSKSLSEEVVRRYGKRLKICVVRPSVVISTYRDPIPGWCNNIFGLSGVMFATGIGMLRVVRIPQVPNVICADFAINTVLAATYATDRELKQMETYTEDPKIYAAVSGNDANLTYDRMAKDLLKKFESYPTSRSLWTICPNNVLCPFLVWYHTLFYHFLAAVIFDLLAPITKIPIRLLPLARKIQVFQKSLQYFIDNSWHFENANLLNLIDRMHPVDRQLFNCDPDCFDFENFSFSYMQGLKYFMANDRLDNVEKWRKRYQMKKFFHQFVRLAYYALQGLILYLLFKAFGLIDYIQYQCPLTKGFLTNTNPV